VAEPSGKFVYVANSGDGTISVYSLNIATGALTEVGTAVPAGAGTNALTTSNDGKYLYATNNTAGTVSGFAQRERELDFSGDSNCGFVSHFTGNNRWQSVVPLLKIAFRNEYDWYTPLSHGSV
jgi:DNA-binding beta-propeller fold protein YncE